MTAELMVAAAGLGWMCVGVFLIATRPIKTNRETR